MKNLFERLIETWLDLDLFEQTITVAIGLIIITTLFFSTLPLHEEKPEKPIQEEIYQEKIVKQIEGRF